ncbi:LysR family transcriptional regulator [Colwellia sp. D2M02]|uniref:LysR family transcriptional regulator n=1 Tax=Colwellia sp. D2M02 TaxID=2841562 RepID=UPI001C0A2C33|nr:LysR family transcriptional regulator [Colwellia sp. D2M02]MBU2893370.1 LysR family transcriptional regulator [Colwellia sp. D2M02]
MEFYHLRSFVSVANTGNLTQAAKRLYTTPPAISAHIKYLEEELNTPLFIRSNKGMALTEKGKILLEKAQVTLDSAIDIVNVAAQQQHEVIGNFSLAINVNSEQVQLTDLITLLQQDCPAINLTVNAQSTGKTLVDIKTGLIDGGYIYGDIPEDCLGVTVLTQVITTIAPIHFRNNISAYELSQQPWIMMSDYCPFDHFLTEKLGTTIKSVLSTADDNSRLALVTSGLGLSFLEKESALTAKKNQQIHIISALDFTTPLSFVIAKNRVDEPIIKAVFTSVKQLEQVSS